MGSKEFDVNVIYFSDAKRGFLKAFLIHEDEKVRVGGELVFHEFMVHNPDGEGDRKGYTGRKLLVVVTHVVDDRLQGVEAFYSLISFKIK